MKTVWVLPSIDRGWGEECAATLKVETKIRVNNWPPHPNLGVAVSWNIGAQYVLDSDAEWLVVCSEALRFGPPGGVDFEEALTSRVHEGWVDSTFGWHLVGFHRSVLADVGLFDEVFYPAYGEDTDYLYRLGLAGYASPRENNLPHSWVPVDAVDRGHAHALTSGLAQVNLAHSAYLYEQKWGGPQGAEKHATPYGVAHLTWKDITRRTDLRP